MDKHFLPAGASVWMLITRVRWIFIGAALSGLLACSPGDDSPSSSSSSEASSVSRSVSPDESTPGASFELTVDGLAPSEEENVLLLSGELFVPDGAELVQLESVLTAELDGEPVSVQWQATSKPVRYGFRLEDLPQSDQEQTLALAWEGTAIGSPQKGQRTLTVPARDTFAVTGARVVRGGQTYVEVSFTQPLDREQNLSGLVQLGGKAVRTRVDGSRLRLYPNQQTDEAVTLTVTDLVRSARGPRLSEGFEQSLRLNLVTPGVRFLGNSSILPPARQLSVPFEAANIDSVKVTAFKVFEGNMGQYLQHHGLTDAGPDAATGRYLWRKTYRLPEPASDGWQRYNLDLTELMEQHPEGMIQLALSVDRSNSLYPCDVPRPDQPEEPAPQSHEGDWSYQNESRPAWYQQYYESRGYWVYSERNNPCHESYYRYSDQVQAQRAFQVSSMGLMAKLGGDDQLEVIATGLLDAEPLPGAQVRVYNYQQQPIGEGRTDEYGMASIRTDGQPFYLVAEREGKTGYLRLARNEALPTNQFDVDGEPVRDGLKGFIYGERDVWRPGDDIHLTFILARRPLARGSPGNPGSV